MVHSIRMPMMGNTMESGEVVEWRVEAKNDVEAEEVVVVVESEKASMEIRAEQDGHLARVDVTTGESVPPGTVLGVILGPDESLDSAPDPRSQVEPDTGSRTQAGPSEPTPESATAGNAGDRGARDEPVRAAPGARKLAAEHDIDLAAVEGRGEDSAVLRADVEARIDSASDGAAGAAPDATTGDLRTFASPSTRRLARELGVSLSEIDRTGLGDRVTETDVRSAAARIDPPVDSQTRGTTDLEPSAKSDAGGLGVSIEAESELDGIRRTIAERMSRSARDAPHVTLNREVAVERALATLEESKTEPSTEIGFTDLLVGASVRALDSQPRFNAWFEEGTVRRIAERNIAVAVDTDDGLLTPVIRAAGDRSLADIAEERRGLTEAVLDGEHTVDDVRGGTFTISNLGMFGVDSFDPIINPPQVAILGVGRMHEDRGGRTCVLSLSFDHRVVDGADAARFLDTIAEGIENPSMIRAMPTAAGAAFSQPGEATTRQQGHAGDHSLETLSELIAADVADRLQEIASAHQWPRPEIDLDLDGDTVSVTVDVPADGSPETMKRLVYAACRESSYASTVQGLRDPAVTIRR